MNCYMYVRQSMAIFQTAGTASYLIPEQSLSFAGKPGRWLELYPSKKWLMTVHFVYTLCMSGLHIHEAACKIM